MAGSPIKRARRLLDALRPDADGNLCLAILMTSTVKEAGRACGMRPVEVYRRFDDPAFLERYHLAKQAMACGAMDRLSQRFAPLAARLQSNLSTTLTSRRREHAIQPK